MQLPSSTHAAGVKGRQDLFSKLYDLTAATTQQAGHQQCSTEHVLHLAYRQGGRTQNLQAQRTVVYASNHPCNEYADYPELTLYILLQLQSPTFDIDLQQWEPLAYPQPLNDSGVIPVLIKFTRLNLDSPRGPA